MVFRISYFVLKKGLRRAKTFPVTFVVTTLVVFFLAACQAGSGTLKPIRPVPTPIGPIDDRPIPVDFPELNENPANYRDKLIRVTGTYTRLPLPECVHVSGPQLEWALVAG